MGSRPHAQGSSAAPHLPTSRQAIAVSVTGIAWAVVHYKEATILSDEVAIIEQNPALADAPLRPPTWNLRLTKRPPR